MAVRNTLLNRARRRLGRLLGVPMAAEWAELPAEAEAPMRAFYRQFLKQGDLCFDIGANVGTYVEVFRKLGCKVVALEPQTACFKTLRKRFQGIPEVVLLQLAAAERETELEMRLNDANTLSSISTEWISRVTETKRFGTLAWKRTERVKSVTLDSLIGEHGLPAFIKIDVEGYESEVLLGLSRPVRCLSFEWTPEYSRGFTASLARLETIGRIETNYSLGNFSLESEAWMLPGDLIERLGALTFHPQLHGDVYVRFI